MGSRVQIWWAMCRLNMRRQRLYYRPLVGQKCVRWRGPVLQLCSAWHEEMLAAIQLVWCTLEPLACLVRVGFWDRGSIQCALRRVRHRACQRLHRLGGNACPFRKVPGIRSYVRPTEVLL